jgi:triacylglycerol lipase
MNWITPYLIPIAFVIGILFIIGSFVTVSFRRTIGSFVTVGLRKPKLGCFIVGGLLLVICFVVLLKVANAPPGQEDTVPERPRPGPRPPLPTATLERLQQPWDSEAAADWPVAETLATISKLAYLPPVDANKSFSMLGFETFMPVVAGSMIGYVISIEDVTVIVFRGTDADDASDWFANLDILQAETPFGPIHEGFYNAYKSMKPQIVTLLAERKPKRLWITGHSLGGALALVSAFDLIDIEKLSVDGVMTFGQPMVARDQLARHLDKILLGKYAHFVNHADIVPRAPPAFATCGSLVMFTDDGVRRSPPKRMFNATVSPDKAPPGDYAEIQPLTKEEFEAQKRKMRGKPVARSLPDGTHVYEGNSPYIEDHSMALYLKEIRKLIGVMESVIPQTSKAVR